jgi:chaperonin cofactor prefoldin
MEIKNLENFIGQLIIASICGGGILWIMIKAIVKTEARNELNKDLDKLHQRINGVEKNFVACKYCDLQHDNLNKRLDTLEKNINNRFDVLETLITKAVTK